MPAASHRLRTFHPLLWRKKESHFDHRRLAAFDFTSSPKTLEPQGLACRRGPGRQGSDYGKRVDCRGSLAADQACAIADRFVSELACCPWCSPMQAPSSITDGGNLVLVGVLRVTGMGPGQGV